MNYDTKLLKVKKHLSNSLRIYGTPLGTDGEQESILVICWLISQQPMILHRFPAEQNDIHAKEGFESGSYWYEKLAKFTQRIQLLGFDSPQGRQALAELFATAHGLMASIWRLYGPPSSWAEPVVIGKAKIE